jgi:GNAT superfamily N-acetyltransferase
MEIRPMRAEDAAAGYRLTVEAWGEDPSPLPAGVARQRAEGRFVHLVRTDPGGCFSAVDAGGEVCGVAISIVREGIWGLSLLIVAADRQAQGIGRRLLDATLGHATGTRGQIILSSTDPKAMRRYARAGLRLVPAVAATGIVDRSRIPAFGGVREGTPADFGATAAFSRHTRGASHEIDLPELAARGRTLLMHERGFAVHDRGNPKLLSALDDEAATALLWACLAASPPGATVHVDFIGPGHDWAVQAVLEAGLALSPYGPVFVRGDVGPLRPYLPSGAYL